jgi:ubiquinol-cytochrome c reductase cytochrome b subunit
VVFYFPAALGHTDNYIEANPLVTPTHIVPEWYMLPFYAILRAITFDLGPIDAKLLGVIAMFGAIALLFVLPWLDTSKVRSMRYRPTARYFFIGFVICGLTLGWCGAKDPDEALPFMTLGADQLVIDYTDVNGNPAQRFFDDFDLAKQALEDQPASAAATLGVKKGDAIRFIHLAQFMTLYYFAYFLLIVPALGLMERPKDEPDSIHKSVLKGKANATAPEAVAAE